MPPPLVVTMGEPAGIGGELTIKAWQRRAEGIPPFAVIDDADRLERLARRLDMPLRCAVLDDIADMASVWSERLPVIEEKLPCTVEPGKPDTALADAVVRSIERAVMLVRRGVAAAVFTNPINKQILYRAGFAYPGHTEFLGVLAGQDANPIMMLAGPNLRVVPVTVHLSLRQALAALDKPRIVAAGLATATALRRDFGIQEPRLAVAGLNPHAGEGGAFGSEEAEIIAPAIEELKTAGLRVSGPLPPDTMFHEAARAQYDAALCMYHDQALIPLKTLDFDKGVNVTLGLPFIRTSPDHGTALDIAGTGKANPTSFIAALSLAARMAAMRAQSSSAL